MNLLGIDFGQAKVGVAFSSGPLAAPLKVIKYNNENSLISEINKIAQEENAQELVVGVSEGNSEVLARKFGKKLSEVIKLPVHFVDETLSSQDAQRKALEAGINRKKRKNMEDAFAAALILQRYLDSR